MVRQHSNGGDNVAGWTASKLAFPFKNAAHRRVTVGSYQAINKADPSSRHMRIAVLVAILIVVLRSQMASTLYGVVVDHGDFRRHVWNSAIRLKGLELSKYLFQSPTWTAIRGDIFMNSMAKSIVSWVALLLTIVLLYNVFTTKPSGKETILAFSKFLSEVNNKNIKRARIVDSDLTGELITGEHFKTVIPTDYPQLYDRLAAAGVDYKIEHPTPSPWMAALISWAPFLFIIGFWIFFMRKMQMTAKRKNVSMEQQTHETNLVELEPDVAKAFSNSQVVNEALRLVIQLTEIRGTT
jgi:hypothetical protein